jgi:hypothetical protein
MDHGSDMRRDEAPDARRIHRKQEAGMTTHIARDSSTASEDWPARLGALLARYRRVAVGATAIVVTMLSSGLVSPVRASESSQALPERATLSDIADDVLRRAGRGHQRSASEKAVPDKRDAPEILDLGPRDPQAPVTHIAPAREGITVPIPPGTVRRGAVKSAVPATGYESNSWRQRPDTGRGLTFSSGALDPASGLDPALQRHATRVHAKGSDVVYGFVLLRVPADAALEQTLARMGVQLLGPHDEHHKARMPVAALAALAALPEVEWVGVSPPVQKQSVELSALRGPGAKAAGVDAGTPLPIFVNLFEGDRGGHFRRELELAGAKLGEYDADLMAYEAVATAAVIDAIAALDFVLFIELIRPVFAHHDQSTPLIDADIIRPGTPLGHTRFGAGSVIVGILDSGFRMGAGGHRDLNKLGCGRDFTGSGTGAFADEAGHGTHVLGTIAGTGTADPRFRGVATMVGSIEEIRAAKVLNSQNESTVPWMRDAIDFMADFGACSSAPPEVINVSIGTPGFAQTGTDELSRKVDDKVWSRGQAYVVSAGNTGPGQFTVNSPGVAKNAITVGNVVDHTYQFVGDIHQTSSRGPAGGGRMKPNVVAPGTVVRSAWASSIDGYTEKIGTSMAAPHVTGLAATLMDHYPDFRGRPALLRAHLMATAIGHDDTTAKTFDYGLGRVSGYLAHWDSPNSAGWSTSKFWGGVTSQGFQYHDITVPAGTQRLVMVLAWDEPAASAGASQALSYDLDLWVDHNADCGFIGVCGEYVSNSGIDNTEYVVIHNPPAGTYRMKVNPFIAPTFALRYGLVARIVRGDPTPSVNAVMTPPAANPVVGSTFDVKLSAFTSRFLVSGAQVELTALPLGVTPLGLSTVRHDGVTTPAPDALGSLTLGNLVPMLGRSATWTFRANTVGTKTFRARVWSENGGEIIATATVQVVAPLANLTPTVVTMSPPAPVRMPGTTFALTDTVQNFGPGASTASTMRYYLSLDATKDASDRLLTVSRSIPSLAVGAVSTGTVTVTIPATTPLATYFVLTCADDRSVVPESDESDNCLVAPATVTVSRPDLVVTAMPAPPATARRGTGFAFGDTVQNQGALASNISRTRYYLSLDPVKSTDDRVLAAIRTVPGLAAGASHGGTVTLTIASTTPLNTYFVLACADGTSLIVETNETNNCTASGSPVTITP